MILALHLAAILAVCAVINHLRGGAYGLPLFDALPGRRLFYAAPAMALVAWTILPAGSLLGWHLPSWAWAIAFGLCYLLWGLPGWGRWYTLGRVSRAESSGAPSQWEATVEDVAGESDHVAFATRNTLCSVPLAAVFSPWLIGFGVAQTAVYEAAWLAFESWRAIAWAEHGTGALWGAALIFAAYSI